MACDSGLPSVHRRPLVDCATHNKSSHTYSRMVGRLGPDSYHDYLGDRIVIVVLGTPQQNARFPTQKTYCGVCL